MQVVELTGPEVFKKHCTGEGDGDAKQLCVLAFLPDILDSKAEGRKLYIAVLQKMAEHFKDRPYSYLWAAGGAHSELEGNVGVGGFGYPALVALSPAKGVCVALAQCACSLDAPCARCLHCAYRSGYIALCIRGSAQMPDACCKPWRGSAAWQKGLFALMYGHRALGRLIDCPCAADTCHTRAP